MDLFKLLGTIAIDNKDANKALDDTSDKGQKTESKLSKAFKGIGNGALAVGKAIGAGMVAAGTAVAGLVTQSTQSYAQYEQLVGGVETLFKDSAGKVLEYANNAFQTAGMSANEYMETVTSFSASLLQSLEWDTAKAAEKADVAIRDMSDNANKMGTDMAMIQNAYQGFAKQNYTMLDNLKLGYGGTKEEMARLLADATALSGIEYDISSYADVVDAIHIIQQEMGITGTTAAEASGTISGSMASVKASWRNLITAMADDNANLGSLIETFVGQAATALSNMMPRIGIALQGVVDLVDQLAPIIIEKIPELLGQLLPSIIEAAVGLVNSIVTMLPRLIDMLVNSVLPQLLTGFIDIFNAVIMALPSLMQTLVGAFPTLIPMLVDGLVSMILTVCTVLPQIIQPIVDYLPAVVLAIVDALMANLPMLIEGTVTLVTALVDMFPGMIPILLDAIIQLVQMLTDMLPVIIPMLIDATITIMQALIDNLPGIFMALIDALGPLLQSIWDFVVMYFSSLPDWYRQLFDGICSLFGTSLDEVTATLTEAWESIKSACKTAIDFIGSIFDAAFQIITLPWRFIWENCKEYVFAAFDWIKKNIGVAVDWIKEKVSAGFAWVKEKILNPLNEAKAKASATFDSIKSKISTTVDSIKTKVKDEFNRIKEAMQKPIEDAKAKIQGIVDKIKGLFSGMKLEFPGIKTPHFGITPKGWEIGDLLKGSVPKLNIDWYAKAMNDPIIMTKPTIFGYDGSTGNLMGGGEVPGGEVVSGANTLMNMIQGAVAAQNSELISYLDRLLEMLSNYFPEALEAMRTPATFDPDAAAVALAAPINRQLGYITTRKDRGR